MPEADWGAWMAAAQTGDAGAYRQLLSEAGRWLRAYYARRLPPAMLDDAVQDALLAVHEKRHTYDPSRPFGPWLAAIARYKWIDRIRSIKSRPTEPLPEDLPVGDHGETVSSAMSLERLLGHLKPAQADAIRLTKLEGLSVEETSRRIGQTTALVKVNVHRGLRRLAELARSTDDGR